MWGKLISSYHKWCICHKLHERVPDAALLRHHGGWCQFDFFYRIIFAIIPEVPFLFCLVCPQISNIDTFVFYTIFYHISYWHFYTIYHNFLCYISLFRNSDRIFRYFLLHFHNFYSTWITSFMCLRIIYWVWSRTHTLMWQG